MQEPTLGHSPIVSIIVPVYQVRAYLDECLQSLIDQSYDALEIILIDDGSTDGSGSRCDEWGAMDHRIEVIHTLNGGLSRARNTGLDVATGEVVVFVDSDDVIAPNLIQVLLDALHTHNADIAIAAPLPFEGVEPPFSSGDPEFSSRSPEELLQQILASGRGWEACGKAYRRQVLGEARFRPGIKYEDLDLVPHLIEMANRIAVTASALYGYRQRSDSIMGASSRTMSTDLITILDRHIATWESKAEPGSQKAAGGFLWHAYGRLTALAPQHLGANKHFVAEYRTLLRKYSHLWVRPGALSRRRRLELALSLASPSASIRVKDARRRWIRRRTRRPSPSGPAQRSEP